MKIVACCLFALLIWSSPGGISQDLGKKMKRAGFSTKYVLLKPEKKDLALSIKNEPVDTLSYISALLLSKNPLADSSREEFHWLVKGLSNRITKEGFLPYPAYNQLINKYNNSYQIIEYLISQSVSSCYTHTFATYLQDQFSLTDEPISFQKFNAVFEKYKTGIRFVYTGKTNCPDQKAFIHTSHNQLEKIISETDPGFIAISSKKKIALQRTVRLLNPWIGSFKKGISYNKTAETFFADDNMLILLPLNLCHP